MEEILADEQQPPMHTMELVMMNEVANK